ncbi:serine/threonine-protein kinase [Nocardioides koreensis]|uniref:non-specific serine/threonine protein kinase n=1 Tax=Nocardioides koreensis TaxID=433651 RepID=A0ABP5LQ39_9ACTN
MPSRLGRYAVRRRIGSGGFATVWLAYDEQLDSPVAVKVLADNWTEDHHVRQRFLEEGRYLRKVESPHVVSVYDAGELDDGRPYLVMSYADQGTLADRLEVEGLTPGQALEVVRQVGAGLQALHQRGILHRDVKPANVLFRTVDPATGAAGAGEVRAMVGDLGLGKALDMSSRLTMIAGTPSYVAPEQAQGEGLDARADQYSLASLAYLLLAGRPAYAHASLAAAASPGPPAPLSTPDRQFPADVEAVVARGLAPDREDRWPDVSVFVEALAAALDDRSATPTPAPAPWLSTDPQLTRPGAAPSPRTPSRDLAAPVPPRRGRRRAVGVAVGLVALAVGLAAGYLAERRTGREATVSDAQGNLSVTVPGDWDRAVAADGWTPPNDQDPASAAVYPALSVGTSRHWNAAGTAGQGVFLGILPGTQLPAQVPRHPECAEAQEPVEDTVDGNASVTVVYGSCPGGVTVERVVQVAENRLLWVQVRSADRATANSVLDAVRTHGI